MNINIVICYTIVVVWLGVCEGCFLGKVKHLIYTIYDKILMYNFFMERHKDTRLEENFSQKPKKYTINLKSFFSIMRYNCQNFLYFESIKSFSTSPLLPKLIYQGTVNTSNIMTSFAARFTICLSGVWDDPLSKSR